MELNREQLTGLIDTAPHMDNCDIVVLDQWPGKKTSPTECFFVMSTKTATLLQSTASTAVLSSRLPKILDGHRQWFDAIRTIAVKISQTRDVLLTGETTAAHRCCLRLAELFSIDKVTIEQLSFEKFKKVLAKEDSQGRLEAGAVFCITQQKTKTDQTLAHLADSIFALSIGKKGNVEKALQHRLKKNGPTTKTFILHNDAMTLKSVREPLLEMGAVDWLLIANRDDKKSKTSGAQINQQRPLSDLDESEYLIHWTRARAGAWPDQSADDHWDDLIFGSGGHQHSDVFSLCRILAAQRILASANLTRDSVPVVCFSNVPLGKLRSKTVFRKHLQRWDFLPYGIAIKRTVLESQFDCRPVIYGDEETWNALPDHDRPYFQRKETANQKIDWEEESEWRVVGDVNLRNIELSDAVVFVSDQKDLEKLFQLSLFDLIVI